MYINVNNMQFIQFYLRPNSSYGHLIQFVARYKKGKDTK